MVDKRKLKIVFSVQDITAGSPGPELIGSQQTVTELDLADLGPGFNESTEMLDAAGATIALFIRQKLRGLASA